MVPDERDRLVRVEERLANMAADLERVTEICTRLDRQSQWLKGGLLLAISVGGLISWGWDIARRILP